MNLTITVPTCSFMYSTCKILSTTLKCEFILLLLINTICVCVCVCMMEVYLNRQVKLCTFNVICV